MPAWLKNAVFYEIYPQSFCDTNADGIGDFNGIISKLDYIKDLGCNALWINPCFDSPFKDAGYDVRDYKKAAARYGTNEDLVHLVTGPMRTWFIFLMRRMQEASASFWILFPDTHPKSMSGSGRARKLPEMNTGTVISGPVTASRGPESMDIPMSAGKQTVQERIF